MEFKEPFFSIIIPLYNKELYIESTIKSILSQDFPHFEVIIVNDGSTDSSLSIAESFIDSRISIFSSKNNGVAAARNYGVERAQCKYIAFLDADDTWSGNYLSNMKGLIDQFPDAGLYLSSHYICSSSNTVQISPNLQKGVIDNYFKVELDYRITRLSATVVPVEIFEHVGGFPNGMVSGEDSYFFAKIASRYPIAYSSEALVNYNKKFTGISIRHGKIDKCQESWFDLLDDQDFYKNEFIADKAIKAGIRYAIGNHKLNSRQIEQKTKYTALFKHQWLILYTLNRSPFPAIKLFKSLKPIYGKIKSLF